ncbi:hypothetical protein KSS87_010935 [Heliosperma pusillum]|nr:hypothetical protein KSS87_010935 [Heliosperma pusillum]
MTFRQWRFQVRAIMKGLQLFSYLDGTHPAPPKSLTIAPATKPTTQQNPAYSTWCRQDQLILGALTGTLSSPFTGLIVNDATSHDAWSTLIRSFANSSRGHRLQIKYRLDNISHTNNMSITDYMTAIKACTDDLAQIEHPMDVDDITTKNLNGLNPTKYGPIIDVVRARDNPISFEALHETLIQHEPVSKIPPLTPVNNTFPPSAHAATHNRPYYQNRSSSYHHKPASTSSTVPITSSPNNQTAPYARPYRGRCHFFDTVGHIASNCRLFQKLYLNVVFPTRQPRGPNPQANTVTPSTTQRTRTWVVDSGASHHITDDLNTLSIHQAYDGPDDLLIMKVRPSSEFQEITASIDWSFEVGPGGSTSMTIVGYDEERLKFRLYILASQALNFEAYRFFNEIHCCRVTTGSQNYCLAILWICSFMMRGRATAMKAAHKIVFMV